MNKPITRKRVIAAVILTAAFCLRPGLASAQTANLVADAGLVAREKEACTKNLKQIHQAIQAYRKDHKQLPNWLSDLIPKYLSDPSILTCPVSTRTGQRMPFPHLADPKTTNCSYLYEFSDGEMGFIFSGGKLKMREFKSLQMGLVGGDTPILRCWLHRPILNIGFDGRVFDSSDDWEELFKDVVRYEDLMPGSVLARLPQGPGDHGLLEGAPLRRAKTPAPATNSPPPKPIEAISLKVGDPAPRLSNGGWIQGEPVKEFRKGTAYIVEFWATWCGPCRVSIPHLNEIHTQYKDKGLVVIGQDCWENDDEFAEPFVKKMGEKMTYRVALDDKKDEPKGSMAKNWMAAAGQHGIPSAFLIDTNGVIAWIGHPMRLNSELIDQVLAGTFDLKKAAEDFAREQKEQAEAIAASNNPTSEIDLARLNLARRLHELALSFHDNGNFSGAEPLFRELLGMSRNATGRGAYPLDNILSELGTTLLEQGKLQEAEECYRECLNIREDKLPDAWYTFYTRARLGTALLLQRKYSDAEPLLLSGYEGMKQREKTIQNPGHVLMPALQRLVQLYEATQKPDEAAKWKQELVALQQGQEKGESARADAKQ